MQMKNKWLSSAYLQSTPWGTLEKPATRSASRNSTDTEEIIDPKVTTMKPASPKLEIHDWRSWETVQVPDHSHFLQFYSLLLTPWVSPNAKATKVLWKSRYLTNALVERIPKKVKVKVMWRLTEDLNKSGSRQDTCSGGLAGWLRTPPTSTV